MRARSEFSLANSVKVTAGLTFGEQVFVRFEEPGHSVVIVLSKSKAGALKDALSKMELV